MNDGVVSVKIANRLKGNGEAMPKIFVVSIAPKIAISNAGKRTPAPL